MGLHLVNLLVEQLDGGLKVDNGQGTAVTIEFPLLGVNEYGSNPHRGG